MTILTLPDPHRVDDVTARDGAIIRVRQYGNLDGPRLMMSHGNGLAIDGYYAFWRLFLDRYEVVLHDLRNHGQNPFCGGERHTYDGFVDDYEALRMAVPKLFGEKPTAGLYHSASGLAALHHIHAHGWHWDALVLFDPPVAPAPGHKLRQSAVEEGAMIARWAARRSEIYKRPEDLAEAYRGTKNLARWVPGTHDLVARAVLREDEINGFVLACPKELERYIFESNLDAGLWEKLPAAAAHAERILLLAADPAASVSEFPSNVLRVIPDTFGIPVASLDGLGHMMQLEAPDHVAEVTLAHLARCGLAGAG